VMSGLPSALNRAAMDTPYYVRNRPPTNSSVAAEKTSGP
jgi:hypothetical protein